MYQAPRLAAHCFSIVNGRQFAQAGNCSSDQLMREFDFIVNLQTADRELMRRLIDFCSGLTYGRGDEMERTADRVYLLTPASRG